MENRLALVVVDADVRSMLAGCLAGHGYTVIEAPHAARRLLKEADVVFLDPGTVEEGALELAASVLSLGRPVFMVSSAEMIAHALPRGASEYLPKPVTEGQVQGALDRLHRKRLQSGWA